MFHGYLVLVNRLTIIIVVLSCILFYTCKEDPGLSSSEEAYWQDYESPNHKWGFINKIGKVVISPQYDNVRDMTEELTAANFEGKWGYIDSLGKTQIPYLYKEAYDYTDGRIIVRDFGSNWLLINDTGALIDSLNYDEVRRFKHGMSVVSRKGLFGIIDLDGKEIIKPEWQSVSILDSETLVVNRNGLYGIAYRTGELKLEPKYKRISKSGKYIKVKVEGLYNLLDPKHLGIVAKGFQRIEAVEGNLWIVKQNNSYQMLDKDFQVLNVLKYDKVVYAGAGLFKFKNAGKWGLMQKDGTIVLEPSMDLLNVFKDGRLGFMKDDKWGFLNSAGQVVIKPIYQLIWDYHNGLARIIGDRGVGFIDTLGNTVIPEVFIEVRDFYKGKARFQTY